VSVSRIARLALALVLVQYAPAEAQDSAFVLVDRVAAVVGDVVIPMTRVDEELNVFRQQGGEVPTDSVQLVQLKRELLDNLVSQELLVQAALRDTMVEVTDQDVQQSVEQALGEIRDQFGSDTEFERQLRAANFGSLDEYRRWLTEQQRRELLRRQYMQRLRERGELEPLQPTEEEMRAFYEETKAQQPQRPATVTFRQIVIRSDPDTAALRVAFRLADSIKVALRDGADFDLAARQFSDDPGSKERGGDLGWVRRGMLVTEFESVAFRLRPGVISEPVHSVFGFHIIRVDRRQPGEVMVRHILIAPTITEADRARARATAGCTTTGPGRNRRWSRTSRRIACRRSTRPRSRGDSPASGLVPSCSIGATGDPSTPSCCSGTTGLPGRSATRTCATACAARSPSRTPCSG
jgi:peptidyl-prolyl cis-trans isomerase SurA